VRAYVDTSAFVAVLFGERGGARLRRIFGRLDAIYSSNLLEAELRAAAAREGIDAAVLCPALSTVRWVFPHRSLGEECSRVLEAGYLRGADLWHLACALYLGQLLEPMPLVTLDARQQEVAAAVGLNTDVR